MDLKGGYGAAIRREGRAEGRREGRKEGRFASAVDAASGLLAMNQTIDFVRAFLQSTWRDFPPEKIEEALSLALASRGK